ncbi:hypothetical protein DPMN_081891 [Dreissena polymorpha]|uniref:Uncharacterized protein n=1 Tax=Dreissena polymorpha TaxID=45954 RepID=A0A9D3Y8Z3_DREPO|nr:hypothetical protein DPMN_081891 [Dreissena polymorpha]
MYYFHSQNILTEIPIFVAKIQSLKSLHVEHNQLASIPEDIGTLMFLEELVSVTGRSQMGCLRIVMFLVIQ